MKILRLFFCIAFGLHYLCFAKIGGGSAMTKKNKLFFVIALALHYLCFAKIGGGSAEQMKILRLFFALLSPCTIFAPRKKY